MTFKWSYTQFTILFCSVNIIALFNFFEVVAAKEIGEQEISHLGSGGGQNCFLISRLEVRGVSVLPRAEVDTFIDEYKNSCIDAVVISEIQDRLSKKYLDIGLIAARVYIPQQDLKSGIFKLDVVEGQVEGILWNGETEKNRGFIATSFPGVVGKPVDLKTIEQANRQLTRLESFESKIDLLPGEEEGGTIVNVEFDREQWIRGSLSLDNQGSNQNGDWKYNLSGTVDGLLGLSDVLSLSVSSASDIPFEISDVPRSRTFTFSGSIPYGYWLFYGSAQKSDTQSIFQTDFDARLKIRGDNSNFNIGAERAFFYDDGAQLLVSAELSRYDTSTFISGDILPETRLAAQEITHSFARIGMSYTQPFRGGRLSLDAGISQGLPILGATTQFDGNNETVDVLGTFIDLSGTYINSFDVYDRSFLLSSTFSGQFTLDNLPGDQKFEIGGHNSVRGVQNNFGSGNNGFYLRNTVNTTLYQNDFFSLTGNPITVRGYAGLDGGVIFGGSDGGVTRANLVGGALGVTASSGALSFDASYSNKIFSHSETSGSDIGDVDSGVWAVRMSMRF